MIINKKLLADYSPLPVPSNYDYSDVINYVPIAESIWVLPLIGEDLYWEIQEQVDENDLSDENSALMTEGHLIQYLAYATVLEGLPMLWTRVSETGIVTGKSENSESISLKDITYVEGHIRRQVELLKELVRKWLCDHAGSFPTLDCCSCGCSCCSDAKLINPNQNYPIWTTPRKCTDIK